MRRWMRLWFVVAVVVFALPAAAQAQAVELPAVGAACDEATLGPDEKVVVYSETTGFRHDSIPAGRQAICDVAGADGIAVDWTEDSANFTAATLSQYDAVVFLSTTGDPLDDTQQAAFEDYIQGGGGYAGIHAASDTEYSWAWYGGLVGAYFTSHPANQDATVKVSDSKHPSTASLPQRWERFDEWYNFQSNPRGDVHVLATLDETSYSPGTGAMGTDHPTAWCHNYDGGRSWYTGGGHTIESFAEPQFRAHILGGIKWAANLVTGDCGGTAWSSFERVTLAKTAPETGEPIGLAVLPNRGVLHTSRDGVVRYTDADGNTKVAANIPVYSHDEDGLQAITIDPDFATSNWVYVYYAPPLSTPGGDAPGTGTAAQFEQFEGFNYLSRFRWDPVAEELVPSSEQKLLEVDQNRGLCCHNGGDFAWDAAGNLYLSTGDDTNPFESDNRTPIDERSNRNPGFDAQRSSANTNDLRGKILRIKPDAAAASYTIPAGNLFAPGSMGTRPEIYAMGFRNPFRISVDKETGYVYVGDYGPDAGGDDPNRGPGGQVEFNVLRAPGFYGWPYCTGDGDAYRDYDFATGVSGPAFDCAAPVNASPRNTGQQQLPPMINPDIWYGNNTPWDPEMAPGGSESPMGGPVYHYDPDNPSETKFPEYYDDHWFPYEWGRGWIKETALDEDRGPLELSPFLDDPAFDWAQPMDMEFGPDGSLYVLDYGTGFFGGDANSALYRVDYVHGGRRPIAEASADQTSTSAGTLTVQFSSEGSRDPDGDEITYEWSFGDGTPNSGEPNPAHTYAAVGTYQARLTVTDSTDRTGTADVTIVVGNAAPQVTVSSPAEGGFFDFGDQIPYDVTVVDAEDGTISGTHADCARVEIGYALGHDNHPHPLTDATGCQGNIQTTGEASHGADANIFGLLGATYTDDGGQPGAGPLTGQDGVRIWPKLLQAEHYTDMRGIQTVAQANAGGGERVGYTDNAGGSEQVNYIAWDPVNLVNIDSLTITASSGGSGGPIQVRLDDPVSGQLLGTVNVPNTGAWETQQDFDLDIDPPTGTHKLYLAFPTGGLDVDQIRFNGRGISSNARPTASAAADPTEGGVPLAVAFTGEASDPEGGALTYEWDFGDGSPDATTQNASHTYAEPGTYTATFTVTDAGGLTASDTVTVEASDCPGEAPDPNDEFDGTALDECRWTEIVRDDPTGRAVAGGQLAIDTGNNTDMYGGNTTAENVVLQPMPDGGWEATTKVSITLAEKTYEQATMLVYGNDQNFAKLSFIKVPDGRNLEFILQDEGTPVDGGAVDRTPLLAGDFPNTVWLRITSDGTFLRASYSANGTDFTEFGRARPLDAIPDPKVGITAFNGDGDGDDATFDFFHLEEGGTGEPTCTEPAQPEPGYRMLFDNTEESFAEWEMAGPGGFNFTPDCTLETFGGLGMLYWPESFDSPVTFRLDWMMPGDDNSGVFVGNWGPDPNYPTGPQWDAVDHGYELQIDATDDADSQTGAVYNYQAPNAALRDQALNPPGQWNVYEITVDNPKIYVRLNGWLVNEFTSTDPARDLSASKLGLQNHGTGDEVYFRNVQVKEHETSVGELPACEGGPPTSHDDDFAGAFDACLWDKTVRYDPAALEQTGGALNLETSGGDIYGTGDTGPSNFVLQDQPAGDWSVETEVHLPLVKCCQQAGLIVHGNDDNYVKFDVIADEGRPGGGEARFELRSETGDVVADPQNSAWLPYPEDDTYFLRLTRTGDTYSAAYRVTGGDWIEFGNTVTNTAVASAPFGVFALGIFQDVPIQAAFRSFEVTADEEPGDPDAPTVQGFADPATGAAPLNVQFSATGLDPQGGQLTYRWDFGDGSGSFNQSPQHTYTAPGTYTATVTATDPQGKTGTDTVEVVVSPPGSGNEAPVVEAGADPVSGTAPLRVRFSAQAADPDGPASQLTYLWDFDDGGSNAFGRNAQHTYMEPGTYTATVTVTDGEGAFDTAEVVVTVNNPPGNVPPNVQAAADPRSGAAPLPVRFTSAATDPDGDQVSTVWDFGDGVQAGGANITHTYTTPGTYAATVTVTDPRGATDTDSVQITVTATAGQGAPPPQVGAAPQPQGDVEAENESQPLVVAPKAKRVGQVVRRGLRLEVTCVDDCLASSVLRLSGERLGAAKPLRIVAGKSRTLVVRLDRNVRRNLQAAMRQAGMKRLTATLVTKISTADGTRTLRAKVTLKR
jgi:cytochrome c